VLSFVGAALATGDVRALWVPLAMGVGMAVYSVPEVRRPYMVRM
jgi:hypothetical protein